MFVIWRASSARAAAPDRGAGPRARVLRTVPALPLTLRFTSDPRLLRASLTATLALAAQPAEDARPIAVRNGHHEPPEIRTCSDPTPTPQGAQPLPL